MKPLPKLDVGIPAPPDEEIVGLIPSLRLYARVFCWEPSEADRLVERTLIEAIGNVNSVKADTDIACWLFSILRGSFHAAARQAANDAKPVPRVTSRCKGSRKWPSWTHRFHDAINGLPEQQREVLVLVNILGISYVNAAGICGCGVEEVKKRLERAWLIAG